MTFNKLMATAAWRYCLTRRSYITGSCQDWIKENLDAGNLDEDTKAAFVTDAVRDLMDDVAEVSWLHVVRRVWRTLDGDMRWRVKKSLAWKEKPWPL